ncbi:serine/threonine protein kinase [Desulfosporosinus nitroreducens]|uniref:Serine/threonine protein kinase n=1 Tax=Desulfosporosinus nitroreducens TaxID=2018668 RepID=A0ABT8QMR5_9FIRM|nr:serine/threonine-protein kinase [Desulfosporosinus nitroreducens]MDO0822530.1 serine/threonine protein kinase [Desulfosporosinus nitroreducens]
MSNRIDQENLFQLVEDLKDGLVGYSTDTKVDNFTDIEYRRIRKILLNADNLVDKVPEFVKKYRSMDEFWGFIKDEVATYAGRRKYLGEAFNPLLDYLEYNNSSVVMDYEDLGVIGAGGFGEVRRYRHKLLEIDFAIKLYSPIFPQDGDRNLERFFREAKILFKLSHPNIIRIYDVGILNGTPFIRMELFDGKDLNKVLKDYGRFPLDKALILIIEIAYALKHAHSLGIVHRDLRPSNIMIARPKQVRLIDFGLGIFLENELTSRLTKTGHNVAGGHYTAPELIENPRLIDPQTDIYSLGAVWFNLITGQTPAGSNIRQTLYSIEGITEDIAEIILKCLDDRTTRYKFIDDLLVELRSIKETIL